MPLERIGKMLKLLIKTRLLALLDSLSQMGNRGKNKKKSLVSVALLTLLLGLVILVSVGFMFWGYCELFANMLGAPWAFWVLAIVYAALLCIIGSIFTVKTQIFESKDNELLLSMPIPQRYVFISRMLVLLIVNMAFETVVLLPCLVIYCIMVGLTFSGAVGFIFVFLLLPFLTLTVSTIIGWIISEIASRVRHKNIVTVTLFLIFFGGYFYMSFSLGGVLGANGSIFDPSFLKNTFVFWWGADAIANGSFLSLLWLALSSIIPAVLTIIVLDKTFIRIITTKKSANKIKYKGNRLKSSGALFALLKKELRRFFSSTSYILNAGVGTLMTLIMCITFAVISSDILPIVTVEGFEWVESLIPTVAVIICAFFGSMSFVSAPSVSLEEKQLWILQTMPIDSKSVLMAKLITHMIICTPLTLIGAVILCVAYEVGVVMSIFVVLTVVLTVALCDYIGLFFGLAFPKFGWQNENAVIKQSMAVTVSMLSSMVFFVGMGVLGYFTAKVNAWLSVGVIFSVCLIVCAILHLHLFSYGTKKFENLKK